mmetsp:Transcript_74673/g.132098  ORF Transcript_74673/g.132098 Transcript_74673/m.132098 type:complete len:322 (-) Transcript_74673:871-1836(-)
MPRFEGFFCCLQISYASLDLRQSRLQCALGSAIISISSNPLRIILCLLQQRLKLVSQLGDLIPPRTMHELQLRIWPKKASNLIRPGFICLRHKIVQQRALAHGPQLCQLRQGLQVEGICPAPGSTTVEIVADEESKTQKLFKNLRLLKFLCSFPQVFFGSLQPCQHSLARIQKAPHLNPQGVIGDVDDTQHKVLGCVPNFALCQGLCLLSSANQLCLFGGGQVQKQQFYLVLLELGIIQLKHSFEELRMLWHECKHEPKLTATLFLKHTPSTLGRLLCRRWGRASRSCPVLSKEELQLVGVEGCATLMDPFPNRAPQLVAH